MDTLIRVPSLKGSLLFACQARLQDGAGGVGGPRDCCIRLCCSAGSCTGSAARHHDRFFGSPAS